LEAKPAPIQLHALGGGEAPPDLGDDLRRLLRMPGEALGKFWQALGPCLAEQLSKETEQLLDLFCAAYKISDDDLARAIKACRFLIQEAARLDLSMERFGDDLERLCPDTPVLKGLLLAGYEPAKAQIRQGILRAALVDHGKLLVGAQWRVDTIEASERGVKLRLPVAMLTLHYREGSEVGRITLQVLPDTMGELKGICERVLSGTRG
jgi:hypothetical protein